MANHILLVDGNSIAHANNNAATLTVGGKEVQAIFGFLKSMRALLHDNPGAAAKIIWDGRAQFRFDLYPEYKGNRTAATPEEQARKDHFKWQQRVIEKALEYLGVPQIRHPGLEADDLGYHLAKGYLARGQQVTMVTGDRDWLQNVTGPGITWFDPIRDRSVTNAKFVDFTGYFTPEAFVHGKALVGDASDNCPGIEGIGDGTARTFMAKWLSVHKFWEAVDAGTYQPAVRKSKAAKSLHPEQILASPEGRAIVLRNIQLMDLARAPAPKSSELLITRDKADVERFVELCERLHFASILRELPGFLRVFNLRAPQPAVA